MKTYWRLLGFARPIEKYAIPYFFYTLFYALFNTFNFVLIIPLLQTLFGEGEIIAQVTTMPKVAFSMDFVRDFLNYLLYSIYGTNYKTINILIVLAIFVTCSSLLSNLFRYLGQRTVENMKINTLRNMRNRVYDNVIGLNLSFSAKSAKATLWRALPPTSPPYSFALPTPCKWLFANRF